MSERKYRDSNGVEMSLGRLVVAEPEWAANQIRKAIGNEDRIAELEIRLAAEKESVGGCAVVVAKQKARIALLEAENQRLRAVIDDMATDPMGEYHTGLRCGVEDRDIACRYEAAEYGWEQAFEYIGSIATGALLGGGE